MALPASDTFTGLAAAQALATWSASWTATRNTPQGASGGNRVYAGTNDDTIAFWNADTFNDDQYSQVVITPGSGQYTGAACRAVTTNNNCYGFYSDTADGTYLFKWVGGTWGQLGSAGSVASAGDTLRIEAEGTTITPKINGSTAGIGAQTNSDIASGSAGLICYGNTNTAYLDDWEGGNLAAATGNPWYAYAQM